MDNTNPKFDKDVQEVLDDTVNAVVEDEFRTKCSLNNSEQSDLESNTQKIEQTGHQENDFDDSIDEIALKDLELNLSEEEKQERIKEADLLKVNGNEEFMKENYKESIIVYTTALKTCPFSFAKNRAILYSNRAAAKTKLGLKESAIEDCTNAIDLDDTYIKAFSRRALLYEETDKLDEALADYKKILELQPSNQTALDATMRLPQQINERNERLKAEMMGKLKDLGNMILRPFGLSTDNFQLNQDPSTGGYSIKFQQNS